MATYTSFTVTPGGGGIFGGFTIGAMDSSGFSIDASASNTEGTVGGQAVLGTSTGTDQDLASGYNNLFYTSGTATDSSYAHGADVTGSGSYDLTYLGTATVDGVTGFVAEVLNYLGWMPGNPIPDTELGTPVYLFIVPDSGATGITIGHSSGAVTAPTVTFGAGDWALANTAPPCFLGETLLATPAGQTAVRDLKAGDVVLTASGRVAPVRWVGRSTVSQVFADRARVLPVRITAGALGENLPVRDLLVSPGHAVVLDGLLIQAGALVNGTSIVRATETPVVFEYFHVELDAHDVLIAEGVATESFLDGAEDMAFDNLADRPATLAPAAELPMPRVKSVRQVPESVRREIAARAAILAGDVAIAA